MNGRLDLERDVTDWLHAEAVVEDAPAVLASTLVRVAALDQDRGSRIGSGRRRQTALLAAAAIIGSLAIALAAVVPVGPGPEAASATINGVWATGDDVAFVVELPSGMPGGVFWRAAMFDAWSGSSRAWQVSTTADTRIAAGGPVIGALDEPRAAGGAVELTVTVRPVGAVDDVISPGMPTSIDQPVDVLSTGPGGSLVRVTPSRPGVPYTITGLSLARASGSWPGPTAADLAASGTGDPPGIDSQYAAPPAPGELGSEARAFLADVVAAAGGNRFRLAALLEERFRSPEFTYATDTRDIDCGGRSFTECFMHTKRGYCLYFATAMTLMLREEGAPARIVMGYRPGERIGSTETIRQRDASAWVEVYFPGWGWVPFDPTPIGTPIVSPVATGIGSAAP